MRRHPRYAFDFPIYFFKEGFSDHQPLGVGKVFNLSIHGCKIESDYKITVGTRIAVRLYIPNVRPQVLVHSAIVRWVADKDFGLEFLTLQHGELDRLKKLIEALENSPILPVE